MRRERATRMLLETVGGVDFAALEAEAAAAAAEVADPVDEAVADVEVEEELEQVAETIANVEAVVESVAETEGISKEEAAATLVGVAMAEEEAGLLDAPEEPAAADGETRQAPGDKSP